MTKGQLVFPTLYTGVIRCEGVRYWGLAPRVENGTPHGGKVEMGYHTEDVSLALKPLHTQFIPSVQSGCFSPRPEKQLDGWPFPITSRRISFHFLCSHLKNHLRKYLSHFDDICLLLCRDISLAAKPFFLNRSKCQVWLSQQAQLKGLP